MAIRCRYERRSAVDGRSTSDPARESKRENTKHEASNILRSLIDKVVVSSAEGGFPLDLYGYPLRRSWRPLYTWHWRRSLADSDAGDR
jgi:hypothetical protein